MKNGMDNNIQNANVNNTPEVTNNSAPMPSVVNNGVVNNDPNNGGKKLDKRVIIIGAIVAVILIAVAGLFMYKSHVNNPLKLYKSALDKAYKEMSTSLDELEEESKKYDLNDPVVVDGTLKLNSNLPELADYTKYTYDYKVGMDLKNKKMELGLTMDEGTKEIISGFVYILNNNIYLDSPQVYDKVLYTVSEEDIFEDLDLSELEEMPITYDEMDLLAKKFTEYLGNALDEDKFEKEDGTVELDGKEIKVTKMIYPLNEKTLPALFESMIKDLAEDDEVLDILAKLMEYDKADIKEGLKSVEFSEEDFEGADIDFCLYTKGFFAKVIGGGLEGSGDVIRYVNDGKSEIYAYIKEADMKFVATTNDGVTNGKLTVANEEMLTFKMTVKEADDSESIDLEFNMEVEETKMSGNLSVNAKEISDKKVEGTYSFELDLVEGEEKVNIGADLTLNAEIGGKVATNVNTTGAVNMDTLNEVELQKIQTNLETALEGTFLYDIVFAEDDTYYDDTYYDDDYYYDDYSSYDEDYDYGW